MSAAVPPPDGRRTVPMKVDRTGRSTRIPASRRVREDIRPPQGEPWVWLTRELLMSDAWQTLGISGRRILDRLMLEHMAHAGTENGRLRVSHRQFIRWGVSKNTIAPSIHDLQERGLICFAASETDGTIRGYYKYRLTFLPADYCAPTNEWRRWKVRGRERFLTATELTRLGEAVREAETTGIPWEVDASKPTAKHAPKEKNRRTVIGAHAAAAIRLLILTGARLREILHLQWEHVDLERGLLFLPDSKTGKKAIVLNAPAMAVLAGLPRVGAYVIAGADAGTDDEKARADLNRPWRAVAKRAGLEGVRIHDLRHTHASIGAGAGLGLPIIGKLLGHTKASTTQRYAHLDVDPLRRASEDIGRRLAAVMGEATAIKHGTVVRLSKGRATRTIQAK